MKSNVRVCTPNCVKRLQVRLRKQRSVQSQKRQASQSVSQCGQSYSRRASRSPTTTTTTTTTMRQTNSLSLSLSLSHESRRSNASSTRTRVTIRAVFQYLCSTLPKTHVCEKRTPFVYVEGRGALEERPEPRGLPPTDGTRFAFRYLLITQSFFKSDLDDREFKRWSTVLWLSRTLSIVQSPTPSQPISKHQRNFKSRPVVGRCAWPATPARSGPPRTAATFESHYSDLGEFQRLLEHASL